MKDMTGFCCMLQGGPDRTLSCNERLTQDDNGLMSLYEAAMCLMHEVRLQTFTLCRSIKAHDLSTTSVADVSKKFFLNVSSAITRMACYDVRFKCVYLFISERPLDIRSSIDTSNGEVS